MLRIYYFPISITRPFSTLSNNSVSNFFKSARQQAAGYFNGIKLLIQESKDAKLLEMNLSQGNVKSLSRNEFLFLKRNKQDLKNLVPFFFISIIVPELIPVLLLRGSTLIPSTCISPEQLNKKRLKHEEERKRICGELLRAHRKEGESKVDYTKITISSSSSWIELGQIARYYGFSKWTFPFRIRLALGLHMKDLEIDHLDYLNGSLDSLTVHELQNALDQRGL
jgi:LETM1 and EF-hand domain-containing protein 1